MFLFELLESLQSTYDYTVTAKDYHFSAKFKTEKNEQYSIDMVQTDTHVDAPWELSFAQQNAVPGKKWSFDKTGAGDQFKVFATVIKFTNEFIKKYKPAAIEFSSKMKEESRSSLYKKLIDRYLTSDYEVESSVKKQYDGDDVIVFMIIKKK